jgi:serine protease Do
MAMAMLAGAVWMAPGGMAQQRARSTTVIEKGSPYVGIAVEDIDGDRAKALKLKDTRGVEITTLENDGPAAKAGVKVGDVILEFNGTAVQDGPHLQKLVADTPAGREVKLGLWRNGAPLTLAVKVGTRKDFVFQTPEGNFRFDLPNMTTTPPAPPMPPMMPPMMEIPRFPMLMQSPLIGIDGEALGPQPQFADFFGVKDGVLVKAVNRNSPAEKAGIKAGDVIVKVDDTHVSTSRDITAAMRSAHRTRHSFNLSVVRNKKETPVTVNVE